MKLDWAEANIHNNCFRKWLTCCGLGPWWNCGNLKPLLKGEVKFLKNGLLNWWGAIPDGPTCWKLAAYLDSSSSSLGLIAIGMSLFGNMGIPGIWPFAGVVCLTPAVTCCLGNPCEFTSTVPWPLFATGLGGIWPLNGGFGKYKEGWKPDS